MERAEAIEKLKSFASYQYGWDSYDGKPISPRCVLKAIEILNTLGEEYRGADEMKLYWVRVVRTMYVAADSEAEASRLARRAEPNELETHVEIRPVHKKDALQRWRPDELVYWYGKGNLTLAKAVEKYADGVDC